MLPHTRSLRPRIQAARRRPSTLCFSRSKPSASGFSEDGPQVAARPPYRSAPLGAWSGPPGASFTPMTAGHPPNARHLRLRHAFPRGGAHCCQTALPQPPARGVECLPCSASFSPMTSEHVTGHPPNRHEGVPPNHKTPSRYLLCTGRSTRHKTRERFCSGWLRAGSTTRGRLHPRPLHGWVEPWHYGTPSTLNPKPRPAAKSTLQYKCLEGQLAKICCI